jgi:hypothetical protein
MTQLNDLCPNRLNIYFSRNVTQTSVRLDVGSKTYSSFFGGLTASVDSSNVTP